MNEPTTWFYRDGSVDVGPFSSQILRDMVAKGILDPSILVRAEGESTWRLFRDGPGGPPQSAPQSTPPSPGTGATAAPVPTAGGAQARQGSPGETEKWLARPETPWRRYAARFLDIMFNGMIGWVMIGIGIYAVAPITAERLFAWLEEPGGMLVNTVATMVVGSVISGILIGATGSSLGKLIFGVKIVPLDKDRIGVLDGIERDLQVLVKGLAFGIPLISLVTLIVAFRGLRDEGTTSWDRGRYLALHRPAGALQYFLNVLGIIAIISLITILNGLQQS